MIKKEEKAHEYVKKLFKNGIIDSSKEYDNICNGFESGWDEALKNQWISVEERLPECRQFVFVIYEYEGDIQVQNTIYLYQEEWTFGNSKVIAWMPIPSFDEILEANKDVLKRLKDK